MFIFNYLRNWSSKVTHLHINERLCQTSKVNAKKRTEEEGGGTKEKEKRSGIITGLSYPKTAHLTLQFILPLLFQTKKADRLGHDSQLQRQTLPRILQGKK